MACDHMECMAQLSHRKQSPAVRLTSEWATILAIQLLHDACAGLLRLSSQDGSLIALLALVGDGGQGLTSDGVLGCLAALLGGVCLLTLLQGSTKVQSL
jgi:hypothetical protein